MNNTNYGQAYLKYTQYIGQKFGYLTILAINDNADIKKKRFQHSTVAHCKCDCGNEDVYRVITSLLRSKNITKISCDKCYNGIPLNNIIGKKIGYVTILGFERDKQNTLALCKCDCGNNFKRPYKRFNDKRRASSINKKSTCGKCYLGKPLTSFIGKKYGSLTVLDCYKKNGHTIAYCKCICDRYVERNLSLLENRSSQNPSCGMCYNGKRIENYIGQTSGYLRIIKPLNKTDVLCECTCGRKFDFKLSKFLSNRYSSCGMCYHGKKYEDFIGISFNNLKIISIHYPNETKTKSVMAMCECKCTNKKLLPFSQVVNGRKTCGECYHNIMYKNYIGKTFGRLTIKSLSQNKYTIANCECKCTNKKISFALPLMLDERSPILSCGCIKKSFKDFKNISFGKLHIRQISKNSLGGLRYICKCDCGNDIEVLESELFTGNVTCCEECKQLL